MNSKEIAAKITIQEQRLEITSHVNNDCEILQTNRKEIAAKKITIQEQ